MHTTRKAEILGTGAIFGVLLLALVQHICHGPHEPEAQIADITPMVAPVDPLRPLYDAIMQVESGRDRQAVGSAGERGPYQIGKAYWKDACEAGGVDWDYDTSVEDPKRCEYVMFSFWERYGATTDEQRARMHNGGPRGPEKPQTLRYWQRVKERL